MSKSREVVTPSAQGRWGNGHNHDISISVNSFICHINLLLYSKNDSKAVGSNWECLLYVIHVFFPISKNEHMGEENVIAEHK